MPAARRRSPSERTRGKSSKSGIPIAVARGVLLDTGVLVAISNALDPAHRRCLDALKPLQGELVSVEGVLVEATHLLRRDRHLPADAISRALALGTRFVPPTPERLLRAVSL